jgi:hypothetical protein
MKQFSDCSIKAGGPEVEDDSILSWSQTSKSDEAKTFRENLSMMKTMLVNKCIIILINYVELIIKFIHRMGEIMSLFDANAKFLTHG